MNGDRILGLWITAFLLTLALAAGTATGQVDERLAPPDEPIDPYTESLELEDEPGDREAAGIEADEALETGTTGLDEITVTAQKRAERLQDVPAAVTALTGAELDEAGVNQIQDLAFQVPNLHFGQVEGAAKITIRGVSSADGSDSSTAFHIDGIYVDRPTVGSSLTFFDVQRVEVLRGPQGTLYGRNATGGAINVVSVPPSQEFEFFGDVQFGNYYQLLSRGVLNIPIVEDVVAVRVSGYNEMRNGYQKNEFLPGPIDDADDAQDWGFRTQMLITPTDDLDITLRFTRSQKGGVGFALKYSGDFPSSIDFPLPPPIGGVLSLDLYGGATPNNPDPRRISLDTTGQVLYDQIGGNVDIQWFTPEMPIFGETKLRVVGSYIEFDQKDVADRDMSDNLIVNSIITDFSQEWLTEINWSSQNEGDFEWLAGLFYLGTRVNTAIDAPAFIALTPAIVVAINSFQFFDQSSESVAGFLSGTYHFTPELWIEAGLRYSHDWKTSHKVAPAFGLPINPSVTLPLFVAIDDSRQGNWGRVSGTLGLNYKIDENKLVYGKFSSGYKSGSLNNDIPILGGELATPPRPIFSPTNADPEDLFAFEFGSKNDLYDHRLRANLTTFVYYYKDLQVSQLFESGNFIENAASALTAGVELELSGRPWRELTLVGQFSYLYTEYLDFSMCTNIRTITPENCSGNQLTRAPRMSGLFAAFYDFDLERFGRLTPRFQVYASDEVFFRPINAPIDRMGPYALLDFRLIWTHSEGRFGIEAFVANALDKDVISTKIVGSSLLGSPDLTAYDRPRTIGMRLSLSL